MAKTLHQPETGSPTTQSSRYTVSCARDYIKHQPSPSITLRGH
ncbi:hypothetical protein [Rosenbergiella epipactidis]|nr:hypothetical protein [Rosenbergiella epipactidis]